jgi:hypothetical protein
MKTAILAALLACSTSLSAQKDPGDDLPVVQIGDHTLTRAQFEDWLFERDGRSAVNAFAGDWLVLDEVRRRGLLPTDEHLDTLHDKEVAAIIEHAFGGDEQRYLADLERRGFTPESWRAEHRYELRIGASLRALVLADRVVTPEQVAQRFHAIYGEGGENRSLSVLFFSAWHVPSADGEKLDMDKRRADALARAEAARAKLAAGAALDTVRAESDPVTSDFVVDGVVRAYRRNLLGREVDLAVEQLDEPGDLSPPVEVWDGSFVLRLESRETVTLDSLRDELERELREAEPDTAEIAAVRVAMLGKAKVLAW